MVGNDQHHSTATEGVRNNGKGCVRDHSIGEVRVQCGEDIFILNFKEKSIFGSPLNHARKKRHDESNLERISFRPAIVTCALCFDCLRCRYVCACLHCCGCIGVALCGLDSILEVAAGGSTRHRILHIFLQTRLTCE